MIKLNGHRGFTIVELLIVIVVIGILAALTIVAFNGVQDRAVTATVQSDLEQAVKSLESYRIGTSTSDTYPTAQDCSGSPATGTICLKTTSSNTLDYIYVASNNTYCVSVTNDTTTYHLSSTERSPVTGGCTITNLVVNPSIESSSNGWVIHSSMNSSRVQISGDWVYRGTRNDTGATGIYVSRNLPSTVEANETYTASAYVTSSVSQSLTITVRRAGTTTDIYSDTYAFTPNVPQRVSTTGSVGPWTSVYIGIMSANGSVGNVITVDDVMLTKGTTLYNYADGSSPGWSWSGTAGESESSGPAL